MPRTRALAVAVVASLALGATACSRLQSEEDKAKSTVEQYLKAVADGDGDVACQKVTESTKKNLERGGRSCAETISALSSGPGKSVLEAFKDADVENVKLDGDRGMADIKVKGLTQKTNLRKENGSWKLDTTGVAG
ncbi:MAG: hypothetical protein ACR2ML_06865 [Solirubrobacteraceae bacterium]